MVDELYLDIEPIVIGKGVGVFAESGFESRLELISTTNISKDLVQLHYKVLK